MAVDIALVVYMVLWYLGNYYYNIYNKTAAILLGGSDMAMCLAFAQVAVGSCYGIFLWIVPDGRRMPKVTVADLKSMLPVGLCTAGAHAASVYSLAAGGVAFAQIVKAAEPAFAAVIGTFIYGKTISMYKWLCLIPIIGGVILAALKKDENGDIVMDFNTESLMFALLANGFAAFRGQENKKLMSAAKDGLTERVGSVGNQFALSQIIATLLIAPLMFARESSVIPAFKDLFWNDSNVFKNVVLSGVTFYAYNEVATMTLKKISAVSQSVANTAKRVVVIIGSAIVFNESISGLKAIGCAVCIGGVFLDSVIDDIFKTSITKAATTSSSVRGRSATSAAEFDIAYAAGDSSQPASRAASPTNTKRGRPPAASSKNSSSSRSTTPAKATARKGRGSAAAATAETPTVKSRSTTPSGAGDNGRGRSKSTGRGKKIE